MQGKENLRLFALFIGIAFAMLPYDYIVKVTGNISLMPFLLLISFTLCLLKTRGLRVDRVNVSILALTFLYDISIVWTRGDYISEIPDCIAFTLICFTFVLVRSVGLNESEMDYVEKCAMVGTACLVIYIVASGGGMTSLTQLSGRLSVSEFYNDPNGIAARQYLGLTIALKRVILSKNFREKMLSAACLMLSFIPFVLAASRGSYVGFLVFVLMTIVLHKSHQSARVFYLLVSIVVLLVLFTMTYDLLPASVQLKLSSSLQINSDIDVTNGRGELWLLAFTKLLPSMPPWGYGISGLVHEYSKYLGFEQTVHNTFLQCLLEMGYLGFILFVTLILSTYKNIRASGDKFRVAVFLGVIVITSLLSALNAKYFWMTLLYCSLIPVKKKSVW